MQGSFIERSAIPGIVGTGPPGDAVLPGNSSGGVVWLLLEEQDPFKVAARARLAIA